MIKLCVLSLCFDITPMSKEKKRSGQRDYVIQCYNFVKANWRCPNIIAVARLMLHLSILVGIVFQHS